MKYSRVMAMIILVALMLPAGASAVGPFGPPQPIARQAGGLHTGIGYWFQEQKNRNGQEMVSRQKQIYSELGYGSRNGWEITARIGMSDLRLVDAFSSSSASTSKTDFEENGGFFATLAAKLFYPFTGRLGIGAFVQGTYYFSDFKDEISGNQGGVPFSLGLRIKNFWDANLGMGLQFTAPYAIKMYIGPYFHYSEFKVTPSGIVPGLSLASGEKVMRNDDDFGGFAGIEIPLAKGFRLNLEGQYTERLSAGLAVTYTY